MTRRVAGFIAEAVAIVSSPTNAQAEELYLRAVDVGARLCVVAIAPGDHAMVYDAGRGTQACLTAVEELVPSGKIDLLILRHSDGDHIGAARAILAANEVKVIIHPGDSRAEDLSRLRNAIATVPGADLWNMATQPVPIGTLFPLGLVTITFIAGWSDGDQIRAPEEKKLDDAMRKNGLSLIVRIEFAGHSVLLSGDTVGRYQYATGTACGYAERIMVEHDSQLSLKSDILIGQHHGADNATSYCFIR
jgi:beta-lactamase superfamily II metal-dependent hydrolase